MGATFSDKTHFSHLFRKSALFRPQATHVLQPLCFPRSNQRFWERKVDFFEKICTFCTLPTLGAGKCAPGRCCVDGLAVPSRLANFLPQSALWEHLGPMGSQSWLAGWRAAEDPEPRARVLPAPQPAPQRAPQRPHRKAWFFLLQLSVS